MSASIAHWTQLATRSLAAGDLETAELASAELLRIGPRDAGALEIAGVLAYAQQRFAAAVDLLTRSVRLDGRRAGAWANLGLAQHASGQSARAIVSLRRALALDPDAPHAHNTLGLALDASGEASAAVQSFSRAVALAPELPVFRFNLAGAALRSGDIATAREAAEAALAAAPEVPEFALRLAEVLQRAGEPDAAAHAYRALLARHPEWVVARVNLGALLARGQCFDEAADILREAVAHSPGLPEAHYNLGNTLRVLGTVDAALAAYAQALACDPRHAGAAGNRLLALNYADDLTPAQVFDAHREWGQAVERAAAPRTPMPARVPRRLRVGFVSGDLREHAVAHFLAPLWARLPRADFELIGLPTTTVRDARTQALRACCAQWVDIATLDDAAAQRAIAQARVDVLIDLSGHTADNRLALFARRAAPVQATWLGYPHSTGLTSIDYRLVDALTDPPGCADALATERLLRLSGPFVCYQPPDSAERVERSAGARTDLVFGSFNTLAKISPAAVRLWSQVLAAVPGSRLLIKAIAADQSSVQARLRAAFAREGVAGERVSFSAPEPTFAAHLARYGEVDIALDTSPYHGTTTTCEALWMGVPVVSLIGDRHASRVGLSLLTHAGVAEWAQPDPVSFVACAQHLAQDAALRARWRVQARDHLLASRLCDAPQFAASFGAALQQMGGSAAPATR
jgi:protein O-GlcNAc transferase